jgi:hypothetical protein
MIAFCVAAWYRRPIMVIAIGLFFPISAIIFPAPETPKPYVVEFLEAERAMLEGLSSLELIGFSLLVIAFLSALAAAFWRRSWLLALVVANLGGVIKLLSSYWLWGDTGLTALVPTLVTALVFNAGMLGLWFYTRRKRDAH